MGKHRALEPHAERKPGAPRILVSSKHWAKACGTRGSALGAPWLACLAAFAVAGAVGCAPDPEPDELRPIAVHTLAGCPASADATLDLTALGDFEPTTLAAESLPLADPGRELRLPLDTLALEASAGSVSGTWHGTAAVRPAGVDLLLWARRSACELSASATFPLGNSSLGVHPEAGLLLVAGGFIAGPDAARALLIDLNTGLASELPGGILPARAGARLTPFGSGMLLSGGIDPRERSDEDFELATPLASAIVYDPELGRFDTNAEIAISPRTGHAAVRLQTGETLLVGGRSPQAPALSSLEAVSPVIGTARIAGLTQLVQRRKDPAAFVLDDGRVFVGGGVDASRNPVQSVEWLSADASVHLGALQLTVSPVARFAPLPGGSILGVGVCPQSGCAPGVSLEQGSVWIGAGGRVNPLRPLPAPLVDPVLLPGARGAPLLVSGSGPERATLQFSAWDARFVSRSTESSALPSPSAVSIDPGAVAWAVPGAVLGERFDLRGSFARDVGALLLSQPSLGTPVVPSAPPELLADTGEISYTASGVALRASGALHLSETSYAKVWLEIAHAGGPLPQVWLRTVPPEGELSRVERIGLGACTWPSAPAGPVSLALLRDGAELVLTAGLEEARCELPALTDRRISLSIAAGEAASDEAPTRIKSFEVRRLR